MSNFLLNDVVDRKDRGFRFGQSENLARQCFELALDVIEQFLTEDMSIPVDGSVPRKSSFILFSEALEKAQKKKLIGYGGGTEKNFLALWLISRCLRPSLYVESGFFKGSSMYSVISTNKVRKAIGFDPSHRNWIADVEQFECDLELHQHDFSDHHFGEVTTDTLVYFDDHINSAKRILEAHAKGFKHIIFDDSCGLTGTTERRWPSMPSLFFIMNIDRFQVGDFLEWPHSSFREHSFRKNLVRILLRSSRSQNTFKINTELIDLCNKAKSAIRYWGKIPDLSDYVITRTKPSVNDSTQHFLVLR